MFIVLDKTPVKLENLEIEDKITVFILEGGSGLAFCSLRKIMEIKALNVRSGDLEVAMNILNNRNFGMAGALIGTMRAVIQKAIEQTCRGFHEKIAQMSIRHYATEIMVYISRF
jgi:hypothetical protein